MRRSRTLIIGLDGATFDIIEPLTTLGYLPTFGLLLARGAYGPLQAWPNMNTAASWTSMVTGYNPGQHGIYHFGDTLPQRGRKFRPTTAMDRKKDPFWRLLSEAGQHVGVLNIPLSYPADAINGFMLSGMDTPTVRSPGFAHPADLRHELRRVGIDYLIDVPNLSVFRDRAPHQLPEPVLRMVDARSRTILHLMESRDWDVLMAVFVATDRVQHIFWPENDAPFESADWAPIRTLYQLIDAFLNDVLERIDEDTTVVLVSDHGFGPVRGVSTRANQLLAHQGLLSYREGRPRIEGWLASHLLTYGRRIIPLSLQRFLAVTAPRIRLRAQGERQFRNIEWSQTRVVATRWDAYVNLRGREPEGIVSPDEYHSLREQVRGILLSLTDSASGRPLIREVHRREDIYHGPYVNRAADLAIEWEEEILGDSLLYSGDGKRVRIQANRSHRSRSGWTGEHRPNGIFIASGPDIRQGMKVVDATVYDIAPTVLHLQGHPVPKNMDGKVLTDILAQGRLEQFPVVEAESASTEQHETDSALSTEDARKIEERLRNLGYLE